jgi:hypothetical protein
MPKNKKQRCWETLFHLRWPDVFILDGRKGSVTGRFVTWIYDEPQVSILSGKLRLPKDSPYLSQKALAKLKGYRCCRSIVSSCYLP